MSEIMRDFATIFERNENKNPLPIVGWGQT